MSQPPSPSLPIAHFGHSTDSFTQQWSHAFVSAAKAIGFTWLETPRILAELDLVWQQLTWFLQIFIGNSSSPARARPPWRAAATPPMSTSTKSQEAKSIPSKIWVARDRRKSRGFDTKYDCKVKPNKALTKRNMESFLSGLVWVCENNVYAKTIPKSPEGL